MVANIPIDMLTSSTKAEPFSPIIWDGGDLVVVAESALNLRKIRSDINVLVSKQQGYYNDIKNVDTQVSSVSIELAKVATSNKILESDVTNLDFRLRGSTARISEISDRLSSLESSVVDFNTQLKHAESIAEFITSGNLITTTDADLSITKNKVGEYIVVDSVVKTLTLLPGKNIEFDYNYQSGEYTIIGSIPPIATLVRSGKGISVVEEQSGNITISVRAGLVTAIGGLTVVESNGSYNVTTTPSFIQGDGTRGIVVSRTSAGKFTVKIKPELMQQVGNNYSTGYGLTMANSKFSVNKAYIPQLYTGLGVAVTDTADINGTVTYTAAFDLGTAMIPPQPTVNSMYPITVASEDVDNRFNVKNLKFGLSSEYTDAFNNIVKTLAGHITALDVELHELDWSNVTLGMKKALACPILKLYKFAIGDFEGSGLVKTGASQSELAMLKKLGPGSHTITMDQNMLPYIAFSEIGSGTALGLDNEIDLFIPIQEKLREITGDPNFVIKPEERGTKYKLKTVGSDSATYQVKQRADLPSMSYNMEHLVGTMVSPSWVAAYVTSCLGLSYPSAYESTTYPGMPLMVTGGDCDFFCGKARAGQLNGSALGMPSSGFTHAVSKITLTSVVQTKGANDVTYDMVIWDGYSGVSHNCRFRRLVGSSIDMMKDYVFEETGQSNPGWIRGFARLYANWKLNDKDLNLLVWTLGAYNNCMSNHGGEFFFGNILKGEAGYIFTPNYLKLAGYTANIAFKLEFPQDKIDYTTGKAKFKMSLTSGSIGYSAFPVNLMLNSLSFQIVNEVDVSSEGLFEVNNLFDECCWGDFDKLKYLRCDIDDTVLGLKQTTTLEPPTTTEASATTTTTQAPSATTTTAPSQTYVNPGYVATGYVR